MRPWTVLAMLLGLMYIGALAQDHRNPPPASKAPARPHPLRYRVWAGLGLWAVATATDIALTMLVPGWRAGEGGSAGALSAAGFIAAFAWSLFDPARDAAPMSRDRR